MNKVNSIKLSSVLAALLLLFSCSSAPHGSSKSDTDSAQIHTLLQNVYKWHDATFEKIPDFVVLVKDSLQVGLDTAELVFAVNELKKTNFFTSNFLKNYENIGRTVDNKLRHDTVKYLNEINFSFQDADPWTFFQEDAGKYWDSLKIRHLAIRGDSASIRWSVDLIPDTLGYWVKLKRDAGGWKIDYMEGFDLAHLQ